MQRLHWLVKAEIPHTCHYNIVIETMKLMDVMSSSTYIVYGETLEVTNRIVIILL